MDEYKFVNPSAPPACVKAFSLPSAYLDQIQFQPPTLPQNWGDKGAEGKQKLAAQMTAWITTILIIITLLAILYTIFKKVSICFLITKGMLPLVPIQHYTPRHRAHGYFCRGCKPGFGRSHVGAFCIRCSPPFAIKDHRLPRAYDMHIIKLCCCRQLQVDWQNIILCDLDRNIIKLPALGKISLWSTNDLESIEANIPYQIWVYGRV